MTGETTEQDPIRAVYQRAQRRTRELYAERLGFQPPAAPVDPPAVESLTPARPRSSRNRGPSTT